MIAAVTFLVVVFTSLIVVRVATVALTLTGLSKELARFQARSAFTGSGFTTAESEKVVHHPVRRRIIMLLMLLGNAGLVSAVTSLMVTVIRDDAGDRTTLLIKVALLIGGLFLLWLLANSGWVDRRMSRVIRWALKRWTKIDARDYAGLLHLSGDYAVVELAVEENDWLAERTLIDLKLSEEGVLVLGIERVDGRYLGAPRGKTKLVAGDVLLLYGPKDRIAELDERPAGLEGAVAHIKAQREQREVEQEEQEAEGETETKTMQTNGADAES